MWHPSITTKIIEIHVILFLTRLICHAGPVRDRYLLEFRYQSILFSHIRCFEIRIFHEEFSGEFGTSK